MKIHKQIDLMTIGFITIFIFISLRPLTLMEAYFSIGGLSSYEIYNIGATYILVLILLFNINVLKLDRTTIISLAFSLYCLSTILWGSNLGWIARVVFPFILFFSVKTFVNNEKQIRILLYAFIISYSIPIIISSYYIINETSIEMLEYYSGLTRYKGAYRGSHQLAYAMLIFSFTFCLFFELKGKYRLKIFVPMGFLLLLSIYCLYKSYTRTVYVGFSIFWLLYITSGKNRLRSYIILILVAIIILSSINLTRIFWKTDERNLNTASSGRFELWDHNLDVFNKSSFFRKFTGYGIGNIIGLSKNQKMIVSSHNDYLELLMATGIMGLFLYISLLTSLIVDIFKSNLRTRLKYIFYGILFAVMAMSFLSNGSVFRAGLSQMIWFFVGIFYSLNNMDKFSAIDTER